MAQSPAVIPEKLLCRFFAMSCCREGEFCLFSHDRSVTTKEDNVCRYFMQGRCYFGSQCRYDHVKIKPNNHKYNKKHEYSKRNALPSVISNPTVNCTTTVASMHSTPRMVNYPERPYTSLSETNSAHSDWVNAPEFVPRSNNSHLSYAGKVIGHDGQQRKEPKHRGKICPYFEIGECPFGDICEEVHGDVCDICSKASLLPFDKDQQQKHRDMCLKEFEEDMDLSFAIQRSKDKTCGICFDTIMDKQPLSERRFGIMEMCNHTFCLTCIRKWRQVRADIQSLENTTLDATKACPECRLPSDFIVPNTYWVDDAEEKKKLIDTYKVNLGKKDCKYFRKGEGTCPFGGACFYLHQYPDGRKAELPQPARRRRQNQDGELDFMEAIFLSDFFNAHDDPLLMNMRFSDLVYVLSDSDDDDSDESFSFFFDEQL